MTPEVSAVFDALPEQVRDRLLQLRELIFDTAVQTEGVGELEEALRWGDPSYLTKQTRSGSLVRINKKNPEGTQYAIYFHCQTKLVSTFRTMFPDTFTFEGDRAIILSADEELPIEDLRRCIALALTYHLRSNRKRKDGRA